MTAVRTKTTPGWIRLLELTFLGVILALVGRYLWIHFQALDAGALHARPGRIALSVLVGSLAGLLSAPVTAGYFRILGHHVPARSALALATIPRLARYVPGKVHSLLGLAWLAHRLEGIPVRTSISVVILMSVQTVVVSVQCGALIAPWTGLAWPWLLALAAGFAAGFVLLVPSLCVLPINWLLEHLGRNIIEYRPAYHRVLVLSLIAGVQRCIVAVMFALLASSLIDLPTGLIGYLALAYILSTLSGFLALFAPAGIGVQEGALLLLLTPVLPGEQAAVLTVAARIWQTTMLLIDAGVGGLALWLIRPAGRDELESRR
ncbi:MAG TPA: hypothetical protein VM425_05220 [Myxococcota bacterium]|nr:hypothetical protein [Myxococcota bacterium]